MFTYKGSAAVTDIILDSFENRFDFCRKWLPWQYSFSKHTYCFALLKINLS